MAFILDSGLLKEIETKGKRVRIKQHEVLVWPDAYIKVIPLVLSGLIKVMRMNDQGNEIFLYYIGPGQSCAVSLSTIITGEMGHIKATAEEDSELIAIPGSLTLEWFNGNPSWRQFVIETLNQRFDALLDAIDALAFSKTDERLILYLKEKSRAHGSKILEITHQEIANELSTTREMVSRLLKHLERKAYLKLSRNKIEILTPLY